MQNVPNIVRERLKASAPPGDHPDADMLTAFSERSLPDLERDIVLEHMARCGECREVVALALPVSQPVEAVVLQPLKRRFGWPALRWGFAVAGLAVIASFAVLQYQHHATSSIAQSDAPPPGASETERKSKSSSEFSGTLRDEHPGDTTLAVRQKKKDASGPVVSTTPLPHTDMPTGSVGRGEPVGAVIHGQLTHGPRVANQLQQNTNAFQGQMTQQTAVNGAVAKQVAAADSKGAAPAAATVEVQTPVAKNEASSQERLVLQNVPISQAPNSGNGEPRVDRAKLPESLQQSGATLKALASSPASPKEAGIVAANSRWAVTSEGVLQRSLDQGTTWQNVSVDGSPAASGGASFDRLTGIAPAKAAAPTRTKEADTAFTQKAVPPTFRAVVANGLEVWAGGSGGVLYHSTDAGAHWMAVTPSSSGVKLSGDIVALAFTDARHGEVSTSTLEVWSTEDAGQTWQKK